MPNPKRKHTPSRRDSRRAYNWTVTAPNSSACPNCGGGRLPHHICPSCGFYDGELIIPKKEKKKKNAPSTEAAPGSKESKDKN